MRIARESDKADLAPQSQGSPAAEPSASLWYVRTAFRQQIANVTVSFSPGQLITNGPLAASLIGMGCPLVPIKDPDQIIMCPHCRRAVTLDHALEAEGQ